jgi:hypothetical protein
VHRLLPVFALALIATIVPEVLFGSTPLTQPGRILVTLPLYGGGAVAIRELARRRGAGWPAIALLGVAYGIVEEGLALGSFFDPTLFNAALVGGRLFGVNWTWIEWTLGYHAVWSISIPILLTELLFPGRRSEPWLGRVGLGIAGVVYLVGVAFMAAITHLAVAPGSDVPLVPSVVAAAVAVGLTIVALCRPQRHTEQVGQIVEDPLRAAPWPGLVGLLAMVMAGAWFELLLLPGPVKAGGWVVVPMVLDLALLGVTIGLIRRWSAAGRRWTDLHRLALAAGPLPASMVWGFVYVTAGDPAARAAQAAACVVTVVLLAAFAWRISARLAERSRSALRA